MIAMPRGTTYLSKADVHDFSAIVTRVISAARTPLGSRAALPDGLPPLTEAQLEVLRLVAEGRSTQAIADERNVSVKAVEQMIKRLSEILGVPRDSSSNHYVQLARAYLELAGKLPELPT